MRRWALLFLLSFALRAGATEQEGDTLRWNGKAHGIFETLPVESIFPRGRLPRFQADSTANWKGYFATWSLRSGRLYLDSVTGRLARPGDSNIWGDGKGRPLALHDFKKGVRLPVFASWYSGGIIVPVGERLGLHRKLQRQVATREIHLQVRAGIVEKESTKRFSKLFTPVWK